MSHFNFNFSILLIKKWHVWSHWLTSKMNQFLAFLMTFWSLKMYCSLRSQCWIRLFLWFSTSMDFFYRKWIMILHEEVWVWSSKKLNGQRHICWSKRPHPKIPVSTNVSLSTPWLPQLIFMSLEVRSRRNLFIITTTAPQAQLCHTAAAAT